MNYKERTLTTKHFKFEYYQKSHAFLYPLLGFDKKLIFTPVNTYLYCDSIDESIDEYKLLVLYKFENKDLFDKFERDVLLVDKQFETCYLTEDGVIYVFNMIAHRDTVDNFLKGNYSKFSNSVKDIIMKYYGFTAHGEALKPSKIVEGRIPILKGSMYPMSVLYPSEFKNLLKKELVEPIDFYDNEYQVDEIINDIKEVGDMYSLEKETLNTKILDDLCLKT